MKTKLRHQQNAQAPGTPTYWMLALLKSAAAMNGHADVAYSFISEHQAAIPSSP